MAASINVTTAVVKKAFQQMWVAGTVGVYFTALVRAILTDLHALPAGIFLFDRILRYGVMLWFLGYFFVTNVRNDATVGGINAGDITFDIWQSIVGLTASYLLGFMVVGAGFAPGQYASAVVTAGIGILLIALPAIWIYRSETPKPKWIGPIRWIGSLVALGMTVVGWMSNVGRLTLNHAWSVRLSAGLLLALLLVLAIYITQRLRPTTG